jgi:hypothetical protein
MFNITGMSGSKTTSSYYDTIDTIWGPNGIAYNTDFDNNAHIYANSIGSVFGPGSTNNVAFSPGNNVAFSPGNNVAFSPGNNVHVFAKNIGSFSEPVTMIINGDTTHMNGQTYVNGRLVRK